jgi:hypothetical protein
MEVLFDFAVVPAITILVYWIIELLKIIVKQNETFMRLIPILATFLGIGFGLLGYFTMPQLVLGANFLFAAVTGGLSGLAATGSNQIKKQLQKYKTDPTAKDFLISKKTK